jgi:hypothetical protein
MAGGVVLSLPEQVKIQKKREKCVIKTDCLEGKTEGGCDRCISPPQSFEEVEGK